MTQPRRSLKTKRSLKVVSWFLTGFFTIACGQEPSRFDDELKETLLGEIPVSKNGVQYLNMNAPEMLPVGPSGIFRIKNGYALIDSATQAIVLLDINFGVSGRIDLRGLVENIISVVQNGNELLLLDSAASESYIVHLNFQGEVVNRVKIQISDSKTSPTNLRIDGVGLVLEYDGGERLYRVVEKESGIELASMPFYSWENTSFSVNYTLSSNPHERIIRMGNNVALIQVPHYLGGVQLIGTDQQGGIYVLVEDVSMNHQLVVQQFIWHFDRDGQTQDVSVVPINERVTFVNNGTAITNLGEPVVMVTTSKTVQFWTLRKYPLSSMPAKPEGFISIPSNPTANDKVSGNQKSLITYGGSCLSSAQMQSNATEYLSVSQNMVFNNINNNGKCLTRTKPNYLGSAGTYASVSYDWGGWDTPNDFKSAMNSEGKAGNLNTSYGGLACSYGVDCSGFVTRVWGFSDWKRSTSNIPGTSTSKGPSYGPGYYMGDAFNKVGVHVVLFSSIGANGLNIWESAGEPYAKVVYRFTAWSYLTGYYSWRSKTSCN